MARYACLVIGDPVEHSLSPVLHDAGYEALGLKEWKYAAQRVLPEALPAFAANLRRSDDVRGVSVTMPHKEAIMSLLDELDGPAALIGAVNMIVPDGGRLRGYNTDWLGVLEALRPVCNLSGERVAVIGAGGAARAFVYGLVQAGAKVTIYNRTPGKAEELARRFDCAVGELGDAAAIREAGVVCNTTSVGMGDGPASPVPEGALRAGQVVFDAVYNPYETKLLRDAAAVGATVVHGTEMLLHQAAAQFRLFTGRAAPVEQMRAAMMKVVLEKL